QILEGINLRIVTLTLSRCLDTERVKVAADDNEAFKSAAEYGHSDIVKLLLGREGVEGIDPNDGNLYALRIAAEKGHTEVVKLLLSVEGADANAECNYAIRMASEFGRTEIVKMLLERDEFDASTEENSAKFLAAD
ncbi:hypothetical protein HDU76_004757, partial [Blyttiomyces sp. JEL0837]